MHVATYVWSLCPCARAAPTGAGPAGVGGPINVGPAHEQPIVAVASPNGCGVARGQRRCAAAAPAGAVPTSTATCGVLCGGSATCKGTHKWLCSSAQLPQASLSYGATARGHSAHRCRCRMAPLPAGVAPASATTARHLCSWAVPHPLGLTAGCSRTSPASAGDACSRGSSTRMRRPCTQA